MRLSAAKTEVSGNEVQVPREAFVEQRVGHHRKLAGLRTVLSARVQVPTLEVVHSHLRIVQVDALKGISPCPTSLARLALAIHHDQSDKTYMLKLRTHWWPFLYAQRRVHHA